MEFITHLHSILRWAILFFLVVNIFIFSPSCKKDGCQTKTKWPLFLLISAHLNLLVGFYLLGFRLVEINLKMSEIMANSAYRKSFVEHPFTMLIAIILITIGYRKQKQGNRKLNFWLLIVSLILILYMIPWAKPLF
ncbi:MAG: hypothetical protein ORN85_07680 [Sediminibacterium sp.]|nr:hypothetical protein [Sediminibacterium sp.]